MKTLDNLDSYSLVTWSGNQEDPSMVGQQNQFKKNMRFLAGLVNGERWRSGSFVEGSQCGDNKCKTDSGLPLWQWRKQHCSNVQVENQNMSFFKSAQFKLYLLVLKTVLGWRDVHLKRTRRKFWCWRYRPGEHQDEGNSNKFSVEELRVGAVPPR